MEIKGMKQEFFDWLNQCPVDWVLLSDDEDSLSYMFEKNEEENY